MSFWTDLAGIFGGGGITGATPPYVPQGPNLPANTPGLPGAAQQPSTLAKILPSLIGAGTSITGQVLQGNANNQRNQLLQQQMQQNTQTQQQEMARRQYYASILLPSLLQALGNKNPQVAQSALGLQQNSLGAMPGATPQGTASPAAPVAPAGPLNFSSTPPASNATPNGNTPMYNGLNPLGMPSTTYNWNAH